MKIICKHNGNVLNEYGYGNISIDDSLLINDTVSLSAEDIEKVKKIISWRSSNKWDFEYGIGGSPTDEYYKVKSVKYSNNNTCIVVKVSKVKK